MRRRRKISESKVRRIVREELQKLQERDLEFAAEDVIQELHTYREVDGATFERHPANDVSEPQYTFHIDLFSGERASIQVNPDQNEAYNVTYRQFSDANYPVATDSAANLASDLFDLAIEFVG